MCELSLLLVIVLTPRAFRRVIRFFSHDESKVTNCNSIWNRWTKRHSSDRNYRTKIQLGLGSEKQVPDLEASLGFWGNVLLEKFSLKLGGGGGGGERNEIPMQVPPASPSLCHASL